MNGKILVSGIVLSAVLAGAVMYYLQVYGFYTRLPADTVITVAPADGTAPLPLRLEGFEGIDATSSPLRFRACARLADAAALDAAAPAPAPTPLLAPGWFACFDAAAIGAALERGDARAVIAQAEVARGVDRIIALYPDGRVFAWHQLNGSLEE